jgi:hypothetical protein
MARAICIRIAGYDVILLEDLWKQLRKAGLEKDLGKNLRQALRNQLMNIELRWQDILNDNATRLCERCEERAGTHVAEGVEETPTDRGVERREVTSWLCDGCDPG